MFFSNESSTSPSVKYLTNPQIVNDIKMTIRGDGRVIIGSINNIPYLTSPHKLYVEGGITTEEIIVKLKQDWPDYVFDKKIHNYVLLKKSRNILLRISIYLNAHPEEVKQNGVDLGAMNALLVKKIEELTLYTLN